MRAGAPLMQIRAEIPIEIIDVLQAIILFFLAADIIVRRVFRIRAARGGVDGAADAVTRVLRRGGGPPDGVVCSTSPSWASSSSSSTT